MESRDLVSRMYELNSEITALMERYRLYKGEVDIVNGELLDPENVDPRNI